MRGIILAGGLGTRMGVFTKRIGNKHLMPIYNKIMIEFPINTLVKSGIKDIIIVTGNRYSGQFVDFLGNGKEWGIDNLNFAYQFGEGGIADALRCAKSSINIGEKVCVCLGDNIFNDTFKSDVDDFNISGEGAKIFLKKVNDPQRFGVVSILNNEINDIVEKPKEFVGDLAVVGLYMYTYDVFNRIEILVPSSRGELEVTDLNKSYLQEGKLKYSIIDGFWSDAGTVDSLLYCANTLKNGIVKLQF